MRNPKRLEGHYEELKKLHQEHCPDWRLGQLMYNFFAWHFSEYGDPFFPEDNEFMERVRKYFAEMFG